MTLLSEKNVTYVFNVFLLFFSQIHQRSPVGVKYCFVHILDFHSLWEIFRFDCVQLQSHCDFLVKLETALKTRRQWSRPGAPSTSRCSTSFTSVAVLEVGVGRHRCNHMVKMPCVKSGWQRTCLVTLDIRCIIITNMHVFSVFLSWWEY